MTAILFLFYGILIGALLRHAKENFGWGTFWIALTTVVLLSLGAWVKYGGML